MSRMPLLFLLTAFVAVSVSGCASHNSSASVEQTADTSAVAEVSSPAAPQQTVKPAAPAPKPADDIMARSQMQKESIAYGRDLEDELSGPIGPVYKTRTYGELSQITFTRVGGDTDVDVSPAEDMIVFSSDRHAKNHNIYTKTVAGAVVTQKTFKPFDDIQPKFSPDGKRIAYASNKNGNYDIWVIDAHSTGTAVQVTTGDEDDLHPSWAPDGNSVVYSSYSSRTGDWSIMQADLRTGEMKDLGPGKFPEVSPDGKKVLFQRARLRDGYWYSIWTMNLDGTEQTEIIASPDWAAINPCWSPDARWIAFATVNKSPEAKLEDRVWQGDDIYIIGVDGRGLLQLTADAPPDWDPCWSLRDSRIYFVSERNGFRNIWSVKPPVFSVASSDAVVADPQPSGN